MGMAQLEQILQRDDVPSDVKELVMSHLDEIKGDEETLRKSEAKLRAILGAIPDLMFQVTKDGTYLSYKGAKEDLYAAPEEFLGKKIDEVMPKEIAEPTMHCIERTLQTGELQIVTLQIPIAGKNRDFESRIVPCGEGEVLTIVHEITTEKTLQESEKRLRDFMESATDIIQLFDSNLNYIAVNKAAEKMLNLSREEILGKSYLDFFPYLKGTDRLDVYKDVIKTGKPFIREGPVPKFSDKIFLIRAFKVSNGLGMIISDVTESKKTEEKLRESEEKYRSFVENFQGIAFRGTRDFIPLFFHGNVEEITGYTEEEFTAGQPRWDQVIHPDDLPQFLEIAKKMFSTPFFATEHENRIICKDGKIKWVTARLQNIVDDSGNPIMVQGAIHDITERKKVEEALIDSKQALLDSNKRLLEVQHLAKVGFLDWNLKTDRILLSDEVIYLYGLDPAKKWFSPDLVVQVVHQDDMNYVQSNLEMALKGIKKYSIDHRVVRPDGTVLWVHTEAELSHDEEGNPQNLLGTIVDITERKQMEKALRESEERLRSFMEASPDNFLLFNEDFNLIEANKATIASYPSVNKREEIIGKNLLEMSPDIKETGRYEQYQKVLRTGEHFIVEDLVPHPKLGKVVVSLKAFKVGRGLGIIASDITERKQAEESLRESEEKLRAFMDAATDNFTLFDSKLTFIDMNSYARRELNELGIDPKKVIGMNILDFNPRSKETGTYNKFLEVIRTGEPFSADDMVPDPKFGDRYFNVKAFKVGDGLGLIATDVTKDKQMEELMKVQHDLSIALSSTSNLMEALNYILDATIKIKGIDSGGIYLIDQDTGGLYLACHVGLSDSFVDTITPIETNDPRFKLVMKGELIYAPYDQVVPSQVDRIKLGEGLLSLGVIPVLFEEKVVAVLNISSHTHDEIADNTRNSLEAIANQISSVLARIKVEEALRESEQRFRAIFNNANDGILLVDQESQKFYTSNDMLCQMLGYSHEELKNLGVMDIHPKEDLLYVIDQFEKQSKGEITLARDIPVKGKDGSVFYADINSSPIILSGKTYLMGIFRDITERKRAEKTKEDLEKRRSAFVSMTSHELRTPITVIKGFTEFLNKNLENIDSIRKAKAIQSILRNVLRLERLIEGVADITRMEQGIFELNTSICDFSKFLKESTQPYKELYGEKFSIHGTLEFESPVFLNIDIDRIRQVLDNLMDNANKNTPEHGTIVLTLTILSNTIQIAISDTGVGIASNDLERIFEQFVSITTEQASGGTGIGLYVSRIICESHDGTLTAHSEGKNQGATFIIELPRWFE